MATASDPATMVLSVNINCSNACPRKVKKLLLKVTGVESVDVNREKGLVSVTGKADTNLLIKAIKKVKKKAEIVPNEPKSEEQNVKTDADGSAPAPTDGSAPAPKNGSDEEVCKDRYCRIHNRHEMNYYPVIPEYRPMPPGAYYCAPPPQYMRYRQDEYGHPSTGYGPGQYQYGLDLITTTTISSEGWLDDYVMVNFFSSRLVF